MEFPWHILPFYIPLLIGIVAIVKYRRKLPE